MRNSSLAPARRLALHAPLILALVLTPFMSVQAAKSKVALGQAVWSAKARQLVVKGSNRSGGTVELYDLAGRWLASGSGANFSFVLDAGSLPAMPCGVRVEADGDEARATVKGAPKDCANVPQCQILAPAQGARLGANVDVRFEATAALKDKSAGPLTLEWDFAGGAMGEAIPDAHPVAYKRPNAAATTVQFVRDDASYRVRFTAWDKKNGIAKTAWSWLSATLRRDCPTFRPCLGRPRRACLNSAANWPETRAIRWCCRSPS